MSAVPTGRVKWYDAEKGFGFLSQEEGEDVHVRASVLPAGVDTLKPGQRVEFGVAVGRRGPQALSLTVLEAAPAPKSPAARKEPVKRRGADELHGMIEDTIKLLEATVQPSLAKGRYPDRKQSQTIAEVLKAVAKELEA